jgi:integrase/recombinase XerD
MVRMRVEDYFPQGRRSWFRLHEKGGKHHQLPAHHTAEAYMDAYLAAAGFGPEHRKKSVFLSLEAQRHWTERAMDRREVWEMLKRRARKTGLRPHLLHHRLPGERRPAGGGATDGRARIGTYDGTIWQAQRRGVAR